MNHPIENRYRYGLCYDLNGQIVGFNLSPDVFVGLTDEEIESALEAYVKRKHELPSVQPELNCKNCVFRMGYGTGIDEGILNAIPKKDERR